MEDLDLKLVEKVITLCRRKGVKSLTLGSISITLNDSIPQPKLRKKRKQHSTDSEEIASDAPSEEDLLFWSSGAGTSMIAGS